MMLRIASNVWRVLSRFIIFMMNLLLKPFHKELTADQERAFLQFCKFAIVGVSNTLVSLCINYSLLFISGKLEWFDGAKTPRAFLGNSVAFFLSVLWSFYWNSQYVFKEDEDSEKRVWWKTLLRTYAAYAFTGLVLSNLISWLCIDKFGISEYIAVLINMVIAVPINFILNKFWAYGQKKVNNKNLSDDVV